MESFHRAMCLALGLGKLVLKAGIAVVTVVVVFLGVIVKIALNN